jgi:hypothetical protein
VVIKYHRPLRRFSSIHVECVCGGEGGNAIIFIVKFIQIKGLLSTIPYFSMLK